LESSLGALTMHVIWTIWYLLYLLLLMAIASTRQAMLLNASQSRAISEVVWDVLAIASVVPADTVAALGFVELVVVAVLAAGRSPGQDYISSFF
jgi:hypothetical protein